MIQTETWVVTEMTTISVTTGKLRLLKSGEGYGALYLWVPLEDLSAYRIGDEFEIAILDAQRNAVVAAV